MNIRRTAAAIAVAVILSAVAFLSPAFAAGSTSGQKDFAQGATPTPYVVGGTAADASNHPWQVVITANGGEFCGGVLIHPMIVLTAAHCLMDENGDYYEDDPGIEFRAYTGQTRLGIGGEELDWRIARVNPDFDTVTDQNDWGLISLNSPASAQTIKIAGPYEQALWRTGRQATVTGFGDLDNGGTAANTLQQLNLPILSDFDCHNYGSDFYPDSMLCAGFRAGGKDSCSGDSGGPLTVRTDEGERRLVGLVSWGAACAKAGYPGVYTRVADPDISYQIQQSTFAIEQKDNFPSSETGVTVVGSGAMPYGCAAAQRTRNRSVQRVGSLRGSLRAAKRSGNRQRIKAAERRLKKASRKLAKDRTNAWGACS